MNPDQHDRLVRIIVFSWLLGLGIIIGLVFYFSSQIKNLKYEVSQTISLTQQKPLTNDLKPLVGPEGPQGPEGIQGPSGVAGAQGIPGTNGLNVTLDQVTAVVQDYPTANPPLQGLKGNPGKNGTNGREIELCYMDDGITLGQRYVGSEDCNPIEGSL